MAHEQKHTQDSDYEALQQHVKYWNRHIKTDIESFLIKKKRDESGSEGSSMDQVKYDFGKTMFYGMPDDLQGMRYQKEKPLELNRFQSWPIYFRYTEWEKVILLLDHGLKTGTVIFYNSHTPNSLSHSNITVAIARDISWTLFRFMEDDFLKFYNLSYIVASACTGDFVDYTRSIISNIENQGRLFNLTKILVLNASEVQWQDRCVWENYYLAHHLFPFRYGLERLESGFAAIREEIEEWVSAQNGFKLLNESERMGLLTLGKIESIYHGIRSFSQRPLVIKGFRERFNIVYAPNDFGKSTMIEGLISTIAQVERDDDLIREWPHLWNVHHPQGRGGFGFTTNTGKEYWQTVYHIDDRVQRDGMSEPIPTSLLPTFLFSNLIHMDMKKTVKVLIEAVVEFQLRQCLKKGLWTREMWRELKKDEAKRWELKNKVCQILGDHRGKILTLINTLTAALSTSPSLNEFEYDFQDVRSFSDSYLVAKFRGKESTGCFEIKKIFNASEQKVVRLSILFLLYFLIGHQYSEVIVLDDFFESLDRRQYYNLLRFTTIFCNVDRIQDSQWIIVTYRESIARSFYYERLNRLEKSGYLNFLRQDQADPSLKENENFTKFLAALNLGEKATAQARQVSAISHDS